MVQTFNQAQKSKDIQQYFQQQGRVYIVVDARHEGVVLPAYLKVDPTLRLILNCRMAKPIHFFHNRIESQFSFSGIASRCVIPMAAIWAAYHPELSMEEGLIWEQDIPDVLLKKEEEVGQNESEVQVGHVKTEDTKDDKSNTVDMPRTRGHLRIVK